jgi:hypothetical protein
LWNCVCLGLASSYDYPGLCLLNSYDYRCQCLLSW